MAKRFEVYRPAQLALAVGDRAGLTLAGVGLPGHFVVKAVDADGEVLFDPFHGGRVLTPEDCERLVHQVTGVAFQAVPANLQPLPLSNFSSARKSSAPQPAQRNRPGS